MGWKTTFKVDANVDLSNNEKYKRIGENYKSFLTEFVNYYTNATKINIKLIKFKSNLNDSTFKVFIALIDEMQRQRKENDD